MTATDIPFTRNGIPPNTTGAALAAMFEADPALRIVAVVLNGRPVGLVTREHLFASLSQQFGRELWGRRPITALMNPEPRVLPVATPMDEIGEFIATSAPEALQEGVAFVDGEGRFMGAASGFDLYSSAVKINAARNRELQELNGRLQAEMRSADRANSASRAKSEFLATVSHEIRTPLNGILGMAQALALEIVDPRQQEKIGLIASSGETLLRLLNDILDLSKIEAGRMEIEPVDADLGQLLQRTRDVFAPLAAQKGLQLKLAFDGPEPGRMRFDPLRAQQCLANLLSNAIKFTESGAVQAVCRMPPECPGLFEIKVTDTGIGIAQDALGRLFNDFTQADASTSRRFGGSGLGLSIARKLARMMGGDISVVSETGVGSTFTFTFQIGPPIGEQETQPARAADPPPKATLKRLEGLRILIADDNAINRQVLKLFLAELRPELSEATNGEEALDILASREIDLVLLDVNMPVMDGVETVRRIRLGETGAHRLPVFALTADAMVGDAARLLNLGMSDYIAKPINRAVLLGRIATIFGAEAGSASQATPKAG